MFQVTTVSDALRVVTRSLHSSGLVIYASVSLDISVPVSVCLSLSFSFPPFFSRLFPFPLSFFPPSLSPCFTILPPVFCAFSQVYCSEPFLAFFLTFQALEKDLTLLPCLQPLTRESSVEKTQGADVSKGISLSSSVLAPAFCM